ncbi:hypothetical protein [Phenylobacterium montanum]|uniref:Polysaccharide biosynthesis protein n=1 Tax=Phenylobacterium montanum TaxID=2823693 RepID=A0A975FWD7_9CAUL|nr:hypothetical protein [Caulobacter sp. S6]QUD86033.1 hypothetical protein KCG34_13045 [Caulobacter sp. S6]
MKDDANPGLARRAWAFATGFAGVHAANAALTILYSLAQILVIARVVDHPTYQMTVAIQAASMYLLPINQAVSRANFVLLRERLVKTSRADSSPEAAAALQASQGVLLLASLAIPPLVGALDLRAYATMAALLFTATFNNVWYSELQMTMMATGRAMQFEAVTFARRVITYAVLAWLFFAHDYLGFNLVMAAVTVVFHAWLLLLVGRESDLFHWPRGLTRVKAWQHVQRLWVSLQATFAEWLTMNGPYAVFAARFGIGPGLVALDSVLKLLRMTVLVTRNLSEIALPRVSHAIFSHQPHKARLPAAAALLAGGGASAVVAAAVAFQQERTFNLLLGHNNVVPPGAGMPAALAILSGAAFAVGSHLVGHSGHPRAIRRLMIVAMVSTAAFALYALVARLSVVQGIWAFTVSFGVVGLAALALLAAMLRSEEPARG